MKDNCENLKSLLTAYIDKILSCGSTAITNPNLETKSRDISSSSSLITSAVAEVINEDDDL